MPEKFITSRELASRLSLSHETPRIWRQRRQGPRFVKLGKSIRYSESAIAVWIESQNPKAEV
jgi:predicted DNA-binding transcriptional regulator AlpA